MRTKVLLVGKNSFIGTAFKNAFSEKYDISEFDSLLPLTKEAYLGFDVVIHLAGIAHVSTKRSMKDLYFSINRDLAIKSCSYAKEANCKLFVFMSSMIVYGDDFRINKQKVINEYTEPSPSNFYGESKLQADIFIQSENGSNGMKTLVIRTPMVYGDGCKGNYPKLLSLANKTSIIPNIENKRSVISIDNLCRFFDSAIENQFNGLFFPQDPSYMNTTNVMVNERTSKGKKTKVTKFFNPLIVFCSLFMKKIRKMFGTKIYEIGSLHNDGVRY